MQWDLRARGNGAGEGGMLCPENTKEGKAGGREREHARVKSAVHEKQVVVKTGQHCEWNECH